MQGRIRLKDLSEKEKIFVYGQSKIGKTYAVCSAIEACINAGFKVYYLNTDRGVLWTFKDYFGDKWEQYADSVIYYLVEHIEEVEAITKDIMNAVTENDLIVIDMLSDIQEFAQRKFVENIAGGRMIDYIEKASKDDSKFGLLGSNQWIYSKKMDSLVSFDLVVRTPCPTISISSAKSIEFDKIHGNKNVLDKFEMVGYKPAGFFENLHRFNTILFLNEMQTNKGKQKYFIVLGDRGTDTMYNRINYNQNWWEMYKVYRKNSGKIKR